MWQLSATLAVGHGAGEMEIDVDAIGSKLIDSSICLKVRAVGLLE